MLHNLTVKKDVKRASFIKFYIDNLKRLLSGNY